MTSIFEEREKWSGAIALSFGLHLLLAIAAIIGGYFSGPHGENWGGSTSGEAVEANLVPTIPLPSSQQPTENIVSNESKGITQTIPQKAVEEPNAIPIPDKNVKPRQPEKTTRTADNRHPITPPQNNVVPYGEGGPINTSYGAFTVGHLQGAFNFEGDFGTRFAWYVTVLKNKVSQNWYPAEIGAGALNHRAFISFDVKKDGSPDNVRLEQSSGIPALDQSATRALQRIDTFGPLPPGYSGSYLHVELWFESPR